MNTLFIFGLGYSAKLFAQQALAKGWRVIATSRTGEPVQDIDVIQFDGSAAIENFADKFSEVTHVLHSVPPHKEDGDPVYNQQGQDIANLPNLKWFGYLSTTGVYGNYNGEIVNEESERNPSSPRSIARKKAEDDWLKLGIPAHLFRLAGIYGPGRNVFEQIKAGRARAIDKPGHVFSRIHREDIAGVLWASIDKPNANTAYNLCDNAACEPVKVLQAACKIAQWDMPKIQSFEEASKTMSPMALTFWLDNKKVDNSRILEDLGYHLKFPDYQSGLQSIWEQMNDDT